MNHPSIQKVEPTVFFVRDGNTLRQQVRLTFESAASVPDATLSVRARDVDEWLALPPLGAGLTGVDVHLPDLRTPQPVTLRLLAAGAIQDEQTVDWQPVRHWEVYLMHFSHHDLGYTDLPADVLREHAAILDDVVRYCDETASWPDDSRFRFVAEQAWSLVQYLETRPPGDVQRLIDAIRRGQLEVTALFANEITELCGHEELIRLLYPAFELKRRFGVDITVAELNDIPGFSWGLANVLAGAGVRYFSPAIPRWYHERVHNLWDEDAVLSLARPGGFWWEGVDGSRLLVWYKSHGMGEWLPTSYECAVRELPAMLAQLDHDGYAYDMVSYMLRGGWRDNAPAVPTYARIARQWNDQWAYPRLINATYGQFLARFEQRWGGTLRTLRGEAPGTDYPAAATCTPQETATNRRTHDGLLSAEKLATLATLLTDHAYPRATLHDAYRHTLFFDEHCWGMANPGGPAQDACVSEKAGFAWRAAALSHDVVLKAANRMADAISYPEAGVYLTVFNMHSWERTDVVRVPLRPWSPRSTPMHWQAPARRGDGPLQVSADAIGRAMLEPPAALFENPFRLIDEATGQSVAYQISRVTDPQSAQPWAAERVAMGKVDGRYQDELVFLATGLPPVGYKSYRIVPCDAWPHFEAGAIATANGVENCFFHLEVDARRGAVTSLLDRSQGREMVDRAAPHGFAEVIARDCETARQEGVRVSQTALVESGPVFSTLRLRGSLPGCPSLTREITLYHTVKRIDVALRLLRDSTPNLELYCAFPFQVADSQAEPGPGLHFRYEAADTVMEPLRDQLPGSNTDYYAVQHWAEVSSASCRVVWTPIDAPMVEFGGLWPGYVSGAHHGVTPPGYGHPFLKAGELKTAHLYSLLMYNNFRTNFVNVHAGESLFRYSFTVLSSERADGQVQAFGWGAADPPVAVWMKGPQPGPLPGAASFCRIDAPNVMLLTWKQAEDGEGFILRLIETAGKKTDVTMTLPSLEIARACRTNLVEFDGEALDSSAHAVRLPLEPYSIATVRIVRP